MLRGIAELQSIRQAILTIPISELPVIAVSYLAPDATSPANPLPAAETQVSNRAVVYSGRARQSAALVELPA